MSSILQVITCRPGEACEAHRKTNGLERKFRTLCCEDGAAGAVHVWSGSNIIRSQNLLGEWQDRSRGTMRGVRTNRSFRIRQSCAFTSAADDAKAILLTMGLPATGKSIEDVLAGAEEEEVAGSIARIPLQSMEGNLAGTCYLFVDMPSLESFLAGEVWGRMKAPWEEVTVEKFTVPAADSA